MHNYAVGAPNLPITTEIDTCPDKLHKPNKFATSTRNATQCNQGISIGFIFVMQFTSDS
jgi:hypothetical protein